MVERLRKHIEQDDSSAALEASSISTADCIIWQQLLVRCLLEVERYDEAGAFQEELDIMYNGPIENSWYTPFQVPALYNKALIRKSQSKLDEAEAFLRQILASDVVKTTEAHVVDSKQILISALREQGKLDEAGILLKSWLSDAELAHGKSSLPTASALVKLGLFYEVDRWQDACDVMTRALNIREELLGKDHNELSVPLQAIGLCKDQLGDFEGAVAAWEKALPLMEREMGRGHKDTLEVVKRFLNALRSLGRKEEEMRWLGWVNEGVERPRIRYRGGENVESSGGDDDDGSIVDENDSASENGKIKTSVSGESTLCHRSGH